MSNGFSGVQAIQSSTQAHPPVVTPPSPQASVAAALAGAAAAAPAAAAQAQAAQAQAQAAQVQPVSKEAFLAELPKLNSFIKVLNEDLRFGIHEESQVFYASVINIKTKEVVRQFPPEEVLDALGKIRNMIGGFLDKQA